MPSLTLLPRPGSPLRSLPVFRRITSIGSAQDNDVILALPEVKEHHAQLVLDGKRYTLVSMDRGAEFHLNGRKAKKEPLEDQDVLRIGAATMIFNLHDVPDQQAQRQETSVHQALHRLLEFTNALMEQKELHSLVELLLDKLVEVTGADKGFLFLSQQPKHPKMYVARNFSREALPAEDQIYSDSIVNRVLTLGHPVLVSDALHDPAFSESQSVVNFKLCSVMCAPLIARGDVLGVIYLGNDNVVNLFDEESLEILTVFASQAALLLRNALLIRELVLQREDLEQRLEEIRFGEIVGSSRAMRDVFRRVEKVAATDINVLIRGETGVGKELVALELHKRSPRSRGPFVAINAGAIPENLLESELFGHEKGAFTGAVASSAGKFQAAHKGTLFLDEIGDMPLSLQAKILRALETRQVTRVGSNRPEAVDIRVIAATHRNLEEASAKGEFRQDLYFRLNVVSILVPPLRERVDDIELIANYLFQKYVKQFSGRAKSISKSALTAMQHYSWPGNVRELENRIKKAVVLCDGEALEAQDLELPIEGMTILPLAEAREQFQKDYISRVLDLNQGNKTAAARDLGVDPRTIFRYFEKERP